LIHPNEVVDEIEGVGADLNCLKLSYDYLPSRREK